MEAPLSTDNQGGRGTTTTGGFTTTPADTTTPGTAATAAGTNNSGPGNAQQLDEGDGERQQKEEPGFQPYATAVVRRALSHTLQAPHTAGNVAALEQHGHAAAVADAASGRTGGRAAAYTSPFAAWASAAGALE